MLGWNAHSTLMHYYVFFYFSCPYLAPNLLVQEGVPLHVTPTAVMDAASCGSRGFRPVLPLASSTSSFISALVVVRWRRVHRAATAVVVTLCLGYTPCGELLVFPHSSSACSCGTTAFEPWWLCAPQFVRCSLLCSLIQVLLLFSLHFHWICCVLYPWGN